MFSGIIECTSSTLSLYFSDAEELVRVKISRPRAFDDIKTGDSIALNGVCLTVETLDESSIQFAIGKETLKITGWTEPLLRNMEWNLERSLRFGDRIHGHLVTGHVDFQGRVEKVSYSAEGMELWVSFPQQQSGYFWQKGSVTLNGVSLTINEVESNQLRVNLIPETLKVTNLKQLKVRDQINIEIDSFARGLIHYLKEKEPHGTSLG